jgi:uncharacterized protein (TIGR03118 family)
MKVRLSRRLSASLVAVSTVAAGSVTWMAMGASAAPTDMPHGGHGGTVLQTNLVSDLPGTAAVTDPNLVNPWGISESSASPFWISDNNAGVSTLYQVPGASNAPVSINPLVVNIPTPVDPTGGTPTGTVFNLATGGFKVSGQDKTGHPASAPAVFLFDTEDGTITGWNPAIDPTGKFAGPGGVSAQAAIAVDKSGNNFTNPDPAQQTGAVYKGLAIGTGTTPIIPADPASTGLLYASNFRAGTIDVFDTNFTQVTALPAGAFGDRDLPRGYAPFGIQVLGGKVYVTYAKQDATKHDDAAGPNRGFVDVFNLDGTPGLPGGKVRLISRAQLNSPWGLAFAPQAFGGLSAHGNDPVLLVGNFGDGRIHAFDATSGSGLGELRDPDGEPIQIDGLWALRVGNDGNGGVSTAVYFTAGTFEESHGLFGSLTTAAPGSPEGPAEAQWVQANIDVVQLDLAQLSHDISSGAPPATIDQDTKTFKADSAQLVDVERDYTADLRADAHM